MECFLFSLHVCFSQWRPDEPMRPSGTGVMWFLAAILLCDNIPGAGDMYCFLISQLEYQQQVKLWISPRSNLVNKWLLLWLLKDYESGVAYGSRNNLKIVHHFNHRTIGDNSQKLNYNIQAIQNVGGVLLGSSCGLNHFELLSWWLDWFETLRLNVTACFDSLLGSSTCLWISLSSP